MTPPFRFVIQVFKQDGETVCTFVAIHISVRSATQLRRRRHNCSARQHFLIFSGTAIATPVSQLQYPKLIFCQNPTIVYISQPLSSNSQQQAYLMSMFHHSLYRQHNSKKMYLNKTRLVPQNRFFFSKMYLTKNMSNLT